MAALGKLETVVGDLCNELGRSRQTLRMGGSCSSSRSRAAVTRYSSGPTVWGAIGCWIVISPRPSSSLLQCSRAAPDALARLEHSLGGRRGVGAVLLPCRQPAARLLMSQVSSTSLGLPALARWSMTRPRRSVVNTDPWKSIRNRGRTGWRTVMPIRNIAVMECELADQVTKASPRSALGIGLKYGLATL